MNDSDRDVLRTIIREEVRAAIDEHEANLAVARVRRSAALEELARNEATPANGDHPHAFRLSDVPWPFAPHCA